MGSAGFPDSFLPDDYPEDGDSARREEGLHGDGMGEYRDMLRRVALKPAREALERLAKECLQREAYLMDVAILSSRSAAQLVVAAVGCPSLVWVHSLPIPDWGAGNPEDYLQAKVLEALQDLMLEDANADQMGFEQPDPREPRHLYLEDWFHIDQGLVLSASVRFNQLGLRTRKCFQAIFMERRSMEDCRDLSLGEPSYIKQQAEIGLRAIMDPESPSPPGLSEGDLSS